MSDRSRRLESGNCRWLALAALWLVSACTASPSTGSKPAVADPGDGEPVATTSTPEPAVEPTPPTESASPSSADELEWTLAAKPSKFSLSELGDVRLTLEVRNAGSETADASLARPLEWEVDGEPSMVLSMAFSNGLMDGKWMSLGSGESTTDARVGVAFVDAPGEHVVTAHRDGKELVRVAVTVSAK